MTKKTKVLEIFAATAQFITPDDVFIRLRGCPSRCSVYGFVRRLYEQGLLIRGRQWGTTGRIVYRLSDRGIQRLRFLKAREK
jgi:hypothetical protein